MEKLESLINIFVVGTMAIVSVWGLTPLVIEGLNVVTENVCNTSINVAVTSQYVATSLCKLIVITTGIAIADMLSDGSVINFLSSLGNGFSGGNFISDSVVDAVPLINDIIQPVVTVIADPIKYTSLSDSIKLDMLMLNELKPVTTILQSSAYNLLNTTILIKALNNGFFFEPEYFKLAVGYGDLYSEVLDFSLNPLQVYHNQPTLRKLYLMEMLNYVDIDYKTYIDTCRLENIFQAQAQLVEAMHMSCNLGTLSLEELMLRNMFGLHLYSINPTIFDAIFIRAGEANRWTVFTDLISFFDFSTINHIIMEESPDDYHYNINLVILKSKLLKTIIYLIVSGSIK